MLKQTFEGFLLARHGDSVPNRVLEGATVPAEALRRLLARYMAAIQWPRDSSMADGLDRAIADAISVLHRVRSP
jgi:hypothetical protein